jgi:hypothetical protein
MLKRYFPLIVIVFLIFLTLGDRILPGALGKASTQTRGAINQFLIGLFPDWKPKTDPYERTEKAIEKEEQSPSSTQ